MRLPTRLLFALLAAGIFGSLPGEAATIAASGNASITHDESAGTWTLAAAGATLKLGLDASRDFSIVSLVTTSGIAWTAGTAPDTFVRIGNQTVAFGSRSGGFTLQDVTVDTNGDRLQLNAMFDLASVGFRMTRHYAIVSGSPTFEAWTTFTPAANPRPLSDLNALLLTVPAAAGSVIRWISGLQGDAADVPSDTAFTLHQRTLANGESLALGAQGRSSEQTVPWFAIDGAQDEFYAALMWSGAWSLGITRTGSGLAVSFGLAPMTTARTAPFDGPHAVFGVVRGGLTQATAALRSYIVQGIRQGRELTPLVTYNTWYSYGTEIDEASMRAEMDRAAALGVELFVIDAGWYEGTGAQGQADFESGLGTWMADPARFPNGMKPLADHAHSLGMKFGIWVEPERVNLSLIGAPGVDESWLVMQHGDYGSDRVGQICLAGGAAREWILNWLTALIDEVQPDYVKWDNNGWVNCDREGHGHGAADGNFAQVNGLYQVLATLRERYPALIFENVSGGGHRLDLAMLRYSDVAWMDDRTAPSVHVRHNVEGLSAVFPPTYLLSFVTNHDTEPLHDSPDMSLYVRSRMAAALGLCLRLDELTEGDAASLAHEIEIYKTMRQTLSVAAAALLTPQAAAENGPAWDVLQESAADDQQVLLCAFQSDEGVDRITVKPTGLQPLVSYQVQSVDTGVIGTATGADLMADGIEVRQSPNTAAHILIVTRQP